MPPGAIATLRAVPILADPMLPTSTNISVDVSAKVPANVDAVAVLLHKQADSKHPEMQRIPAEFREIVLQLRSAEMFTGKSNELTIQLVEGKPSRRLLIVGLGNIDVFSAECLREGAAVVARAARKHKLKRVALVVPPLPKQLPGRPKALTLGQGRAVGIDAVATGLITASFDWVEYRGAVTKKKHEREKTAFTLVVPDADLNESRDAAKRAVVIAE